jgi:hypothetical protein
MFAARMRFDIHERSVSYEDDGEPIGFTVNSQRSLHTKRGTKMTFVDADTHVDEREATWSYIAEKDQHLVPRTIEFTAEETPSFLAPGYQRFWFIDGRLAPRRHRLDARTGTTLETRELIDIGARLRDMDTLGIDTQVIYPTVFLHEPSQREDVLVALHGSYNRWMADRCAESGGRLRWVAMIPYVSMSDALDEIRFAKEHGAVGIFKLGIECGGRSAGDPYFMPAYRAAADYDLALCVHQGSPWTPVNKFLSPFTQTKSGETPVYEAFSALLRLKLADRLPNELRVGFIEAGSGWVPHVLGTLGLRPGTEQPLADSQFFVACETFEDIPNVLNAVGGDDNLIIGTDYTHGDRSSVMTAHKTIMERQDLDEKSALKITSQNGRTLYSL